ncbi:hypothetical protein OIE68_00680 [Nocardia vinacea]|uniref:hypothetical protein n=1 Tax=Nocardia vinacea TaxID=96468 RepID=UPI002E10BEDA|nr:hypothetical protein OIE68_00680 [Nocardia vinacea]
MTQRAMLIRGLGIARLAIGLSAFAQPAMTRRSLGVAGQDADGGVVARMFGIRDAALGLATLSSDPAVQRVGLQLGVLADAADTAAVLLGRRGGVTASGATVVGGGAALFALAGLAALPKRARPPIR